MNHGGYDWNDAAIQRLRGLWTEGHSTAEIGRRMGVSKNAIVGKAHRLDLAKRADPVRKLSSEGPRKRKPVVERKVFLPPLPPPVVFVTPPKPHIEAPKPVQDDPEPVLAMVAPAMVKTGPRGCLYPLGNRLPTGGFLECGEALATASYCHEHSAVCYTSYRGAA